MLEKPLFSILIANYNNAHFITEAIDSIKRQTYTNWEVIIVDDCSTDHSEQVISAFIDTDPRIKLFTNQKNSGCGFTKRRCVEVSAGELCAFVDPDDALVENAIEISVNTHLTNPQVSITFSNSFSCNPELKIKSTRLLKQPSRGKSLLESFSDDVAGFHFATFKKSAYNLTEGLDHNCLRAVDMDLYYKLEEVGEIYFIDEALYKYRVHARGISIGNNFHKALSWHFYVVIETCKRRGLIFEDFIPELIQKDIVRPTKKSKDYKTGQLVLKPFRAIKKILLQ